MADINQETANLIAQIPPASRVEELKSLAQSATSREERERATAIVLRAIKDYRKLGSVLKVGSSIQDYPDLLKLGYPSTKPVSSHLYAFRKGQIIYTLRLGAWISSPQQGEQWLFYLDYDEKGIILGQRPILLSLP